MNHLASKLVCIALPLLSLIPLLYLFFPPVYPSNYARLLCIQQAMPQAARQTKETKEKQNGTKTPLLEPDTEAEGDELDFGQVGFHCTLDKQMPRKAIA